MRIAVVGSGYVGLVAGACLAETGHDVIAIDIDKKKIAALRNGQVPFYEPGLSEILKRNITDGRLKFSSDLKNSIPGRQVVFIAVGTPQSEDGSADLRYVLQVAAEIGQAMVEPLVVVNKSTVPVGTAHKVAKVIAEQTDIPVNVVSNPEFLKEGAAIADFLRPDRIIIGTDDEKTRQIMADIYGPYTRTGKPILFMDNLSAEITKYCANGLLAARISYMNEVAKLCDAVGADVGMVRLGVGSDNRIGNSFLFPGVGYGGSCFPKDVRALVNTGNENGIDMLMAKATDKVNEEQKQILVRRIRHRFGANLTGKCFALWGLSFKARTDDVREAPALVIAEELLSMGARLKVYDPEAMNTARQVLNDRVTYCSNNYDACQGADALVVATEWNSFRRPDFDRIAELMNQSVVFDGRNLYDPKRMREQGFEHISIGRNRQKQVINNNCNRRKTKHLHVVGMK